MPALSGMPSHPTAAAPVPHRHRGHLQCVQGTTALRGAQMVHDPTKCRRDIQRDVFDKVFPYLKGRGGERRWRGCF